MEIDAGSNHIEDILRNYGIDPFLAEINEFKQGHINDSYIINVRDRCKYFLQRINHHVFKDPEGLMDNHVLVNEAMAKHYGSEKNSPYPRIIKNRNKKHFFNDNEGSFWRLMEYVPDCRSFNIAENADVAFEGAAAFGQFQKVMSKQKAADYTPTIPDFHHLGNRLGKLQEAISVDTESRVKDARPEITFVLDRMEYAQILTDLLRKKIIPVRVTHNDTKLNNVLFEKKRIKHICVVDLDTVMPGTLLYDYGDMVRTFTSPVEEDEPDVSKVVLREDIFEALTRGYLKDLSDALTAGERQHLLFGAKVMLLMIGARFLTDYLEGDHYFKTSRDNHNLDRARNQFALLQQLEKNEIILKGMIHSCL
jgi:hypothetical protein